MNDKEYNIVELSGKQKLGILQLCFCLCVLPSCIRSQKSCKICTEVSEILGVTITMKNWQEGNHLFSVCSYVTLNKVFFLKGLYFSFAKKKKKKANLSLPNVFDSCIHLGLFVCLFVFGNCISVCFISLPIVPNVGLKMET